MKDISNELTQVIQDKQCSSLLAFIMVKNDEFHIQESQSEEQSCRRLCDKRDININE